jgi:hypothetical protein
MPSKRARRVIAAVASEETSRGAEPGFFQLPPYWEERPEMWFNQAEGLMRGLGITDPLYQAVLVQTALTRPQQEAVAHILEQSPQPPDVFQQLRAELTRIHGKSEWRRMGELFALPPLGDQRPGELLVQMKRLRPEDQDLWFRWQFFSRLPEWAQRQLAGHNGSVEELAARAEELLQKAPVAVPVAAAPEAEVVAAACNLTPRRPGPKKGGSAARKRRQSDEPNTGGQGTPGSGSAAETDPTPWERAGMCRSHWDYGDQATECNQPCDRSEN